jgi:hypothetical protein
MCLNKITKPQYVRRPRSFTRTVEPLMMMMMTHTNMAFALNSEAEKKANTIS